MKSKTGALHVVGNYSHQPDGKRVLDATGKRVLAGAGDAVAARTPCRQCLLPEVDRQLDL